MHYIYDIKAEECIKNLHINKKYFDSKNKFLYLKTINDKNDISLLSLDYVKKVSNHSKKINIFKSCVRNLNKEDIHLIACTIAFYGSTDHLIDFLNLVDCFDPNYRINIKLFFKNLNLYSGNVYFLKDINILESAIYGNKISTIDYLVYRYHYKFWNEFLRTVSNKYGSMFTYPFTIFKMGYPDYSYKIDDTELITGPIIDQFFKNKLDDILISIFNENPNMTFLNRLLNTVIYNDKYYALAKIYNNNLHSLIPGDDFKTILLELNKQIFDFNKKINIKKNSKNICGIFRILMKYYNEFLSVDEIRNIFNDRVFLTSVAAFQNGIEIFKLIDKFIDDYNYIDDCGYRLIDDAAKYGSLSTFKFLEKRTNSINDNFNNIDFVDSIYNICFYNSNLDVIEYIFNKYSIPYECLKNIYFDRTFQIISNTKKKIEKFKILSNVINIKDFLPIIFSRWYDISITEIKQLIKICEKSSDSLYNVNNSYKFIYYPNDISIPKRIFNTNSLDIFKRLLKLYEHNNDLLMLCFERTIKFKCIHSKWVSEFDKYLEKKHYLCRFKLFNKDSDFSIDNCPHKTYYNCLMDTFKILKTELYEEDYTNLKQNMDTKKYSINSIYNYTNSWMGYDKIDRWDNPEFLRFYFLTVLNVNISFLQNNSYYEFESIKGWFLLHKYLKRKVRKIYFKKFNDHKAKLRPLINMLEYEPNFDDKGINKNIGRKFKINYRKNMCMDKKNTNPIHLKPEHLLCGDFDKYDYYISEKADGITKKLDIRSTKFYPKFPRKYNGYLNVEYVKELNIHFVYGIENEEIDDFEFISELLLESNNKNIESFNDIMNFYNNDFDMISNLQTKIKEKTFSKNTVFWVPKRIFKVFGVNMMSLLDELSDKNTSLFPTDGWIFWKNNKYLDSLDDITYYKMKPLKHLTIDLTFNGESEMLDFEKNKYRVFVGDQKLEKGKIYRCYYDDEKMLWSPRVDELRSDKKNPNNYEIVKYITKSHTNHKWKIRDIINIKEVDYYAKNNFENTKLSDNYKKIFGKINKGSVLDIACGYTPLKRDFNKLLGKVKYTGIDSDFNVFDISKKRGYDNVYWYDLNLPGNERWGNLYNYFVDKKGLDKVLNSKYDNILIINSIHYFDEKKLFGIIKKNSKPGTRVYVKYLSKELFNEKITDFEGYIDNDDNYVVKEGEDKLKIYYHWTHKKPQIEKLVSSSSLNKNFEDIGFKKRDVSFYDGINYGNVWNEYMKCFVLEEYVCL